MIHIYLGGSTMALKLGLQIGLIVVCVLVCIFVLVQEGKDAGFGSLTGSASNDSYMSKNRGRTLEGRLERITAVLGFLFIVLSLVLNLKKFS